VTGNADNSPQTVAVDLTVTARPMIALAPTTLSFTALEGDNPAGQSFSITNAGGGVLTWNGTDDAAELSMTPASGSLSAGASQNVTVSVSSAALAAGTYGVTITVTGNAGNTPQSVAVGLVVVGAPTSSDVANALLGEQQLTPEQIAYLDGIGNKNGRLDLGDFLAWLDLHGPNLSADDLKQIRSALQEKLIKGNRE
jgi:hypothetical protein